MENSNEIKGAYQAGMTWLSDGDIALTELLIIYIQMHKDFLEFKNKYPENDKIPVQEARFKLIHKSIAMIQRTMISEKALRAEMQALRTTVGFQQEIIAQQAGEIEDLKEKLQGKENFDGSNN